MFVDATTIFGAPIRHDPQHRQIVLLVEWQDPVIQQIGGGNPTALAQFRGVRHQDC